MSRRPLILLVLLLAVPLAAASGAPRVAAAAGRAKAVPARGRVTGQHGHPVPNAHLAFFADPHGFVSRVTVMSRVVDGRIRATPAATAVTDAHGRFHLAALGRGEYLVVVRRHHRVIGAVHVTHDAKHPHRSLALALDHEVVVGGVVVRGDKPAAGVEVTVGGAFYDLPPVRTGPKGRFRVRAPIPRTPYLVQVQGQGVARTRTLAQAGDDNRVKVLAGAAVSGVVRYHGAPVAGAEVQTRTPVPFRQKTTTGPHGHFTLPGLMAGRGRYTLDARKGDAAGTAQVDPGVSAPVTIVLKAPGRLVAHVVADAGQPITGARVEANGTSAVTDAKGVARIPSVPQGTVAVRAVAPGYAEAKAEAHLAGTEAQVTLSLAPGGALVVEVPGLAKADTAHARVYVQRYLAGPYHDLSRHAGLDHHGRARIEGLPSGHYVVGVTGLHGPLPAAVRVTVPRKAPVRLALPRPGTLAGRVVDGAGHPLAHQQVAVRRAYAWDAPRDRHFLPLWSTSTDAHGRFRFRSLAAGRYRLVAGGSPHYPEQKPELVHTGRRKVVVHLHRSLTIAGVLVDLAGQPVAGAEVQAEPEAPDPSPMGYQPDHTAKTDAQGRFSITDLPQGAFVLEASGHGDRTHLVAVPAGSHDLTLVVGPIQ